MRGRVTSAKDIRGTTPGKRQMSIKDFGGDIEDAKQKRGSVKKLVANKNLSSLLVQWKEIDTQIKSLTARKDALKTEIMAQTADAQADASGHKYAHVDRFTIKHEVRRSISLKPVEEVNPRFLEVKGIPLKNITKTHVTFDEEKVEQFVAEGRITKDEVEHFLVNIKESVALKVTEDENNEDEKD